MASQNDPPSLWDSMPSLVKLNLVWHATDHTTRVLRYTCKETNMLRRWVVEKIRPHNEGIEFLRNHMHENESAIECCERLQSKLEFVTELLARKDVHMHYTEDQMETAICRKLALKRVLEEFPSHIMNLETLCKCPANKIMELKKGDLGLLRCPAVDHLHEENVNGTEDDKQGPEASETDDLPRLKNLCMKLNSGIDEERTKSKGKPEAFGPRPTDIFSSKEEYLVEVIIEMLQEFSRGDGVSTSELRGVVASLLKYFSFGHFSKATFLEVNLPEVRQQAIRRYGHFVSFALPSSVYEGGVVPMTDLVHRLQNALSSMEHFPVASRSSDGNYHLSSGLSSLSQPFKLCLCRAQGEKSLLDYSSNVVLIEPLISLADVEEFLWPRIQLSESGQMPSVSAGNSESGTTPAGTGVLSPSATPATRHHSMHSRSSIDLLLEKNSSSVKGKGKVVLMPNQEVGRGPQTRNAVRRRASVDIDDKIEPVEGDTSSEDDALDISHTDGALVIEDDDISDEDDDDALEDDTLIWIEGEAHDVKLGDPVEANHVPTPGDLQNNRTCSSSSKGSAEFRGGSSSGSNRCERGGRERTGRHLFGSKHSQRLIFTAGGRQLNRHSTIYKAIKRQLVLNEDDEDRFCGSYLVSSERSGLGSDIYTVMYQRADNQAQRSSLVTVSSTTPSKPTKSNSGSDASAHHVSLLDSILQGALPCDMERSNPTYNILALLRVLEGLNRLAPRLHAHQVTNRFAEGKVLSLDELSTTGVKVPSKDFINGTLTAKLARQIQDALEICSDALPSWCYQLTKACPFLFPFESKRQYFYSTAFGLSRALYRLQQQRDAHGHRSTGEREVLVGELQRQKVSISRSSILDSAVKVMELFCSKEDIIEVKYFGEIGSGLGPTMEFYTLLSHELQKVGLGMWRSSLGRPSTEIEAVGHSAAGGDKDIIHAPLGLFPCPWPPDDDTSDGSKFSKTIEYYRLLGRLMARALKDWRLLDLPLSAAFYKLVLGQELDLHDIVSFDAELGTSLQELQALVYRKQYLESTGSYHSEELRFRGASIEDLCLGFSLPGYPEYILKPSNENVNMSTLGEYVSLVVEATVRTGIMQQIEAFRLGFNQVFDISSLQIFSPNELDYLLCGRRELWKAEELADHIKFDHGYTSKSPAIVYLLEIMGEFTPDQQRAFCQFVTGSPRLPPGGLAVLNPKLTVVRKHSSGMSRNANNGSGPTEFADHELPSVMTCTNYLKLPPYSSKEIMYKKLLYAITEGQGSFELS